MTPVGSGIEITRFRRGSQSRHGRVPLTAFCYKTTAIHVPSLKLINLNQFPTDLSPAVKRSANDRRTWRG